MATVDKNLASGTNASTTLNTLLTVTASRNVVFYSVIFTNLTANIITVSVYMNDGTDRLFETVKIPAGVGKALDVKKLRGNTLQGNQSLLIQAASADSFNYKISGAERT